MQLDRDLHDMGGYEEPLYPMGVGVQPGEVPGQHVVAMTEEISVG